MAIQLSTLVKDKADVQTRITSLEDERVRVQSILEALEPKMVEMSDRLNTSNALLVRYYDESRSAQLLNEMQFAEMLEKFVTQERMTVGNKARFDSMLFEMNKRLGDRITGLSDKTKERAERAAAAAEVAAIERDTKLRADMLK